jgi:hypothetical protein
VARHERTGRIAFGTWDFSVLKLGFLADSLSKPILIGFVGGLGSHRGAGATRQLNRSAIQPAGTIRIAR